MKIPKEIDERLNGERYNVRMATRSGKQLSTRLVDIRVVDFVTYIFTLSNGMVVVFNPETCGVSPERVKEVVEGMKRE